MADLQAALQTQLRNIEAKTGKTIAQLHAAVAASGAVKHGEKRSWLMERYPLGYGDANTVVSLIGKLEPAPPAGVTRWMRSTPAPRPACVPCTTR